MPVFKKMRKTYCNYLIKVLIYNYRNTRDTET